MVAPSGRYTKTDDGANRLATIESSKLPRSFEQAQSASVRRPHPFGLCTVIRHENHTKQHERRVVGWLVEMWKGGIRHSVEGRGGSGGRVRSQWVVPVSEVVNTGAAEGRGRQGRPVRGAKCLVLGAKEEFEIPYSGRSRAGVCNRAEERVVRSAKRSNAAWPLYGG